VDVASRWVTEMLEISTRFVPDRLQFLCGLCRGRSVLHLGFADALVYEESLATRRHIHQALREAGASGAVFGLDIDAAVVEHFRREWGDPNLIVGDAEDLPALSLARAFDIVVAGELVEHLSNPGRFLTGVGRLLAPDGRLVLTTPNGIGLKYFLHAAAGRDRSHPDHALLFSFSTLNTLLARHGFVPTEWATTMEEFERPRNRRTRRLLRWLFRRYPAIADTVVVVATRMR
jgi:SAM-dependent methyltransferase